MHTLRSIVTFTGALVLAAPVAFAESLSSGVPGEWLSRWTGARAAGLGGANVASADEALGAMWNPAGLARLSQNEVHFETSRLFEDTAVHGFSVARPAHRFPSVGLTMLSLRSGDFEKTNDLNESLGDFDEGDLAFLFTVSQSLGRRLSVGANVKVVRQSIDEFEASGWGADVGILYDVTSKVRVAVSLLNAVGPTMKLREVGETYPVEVREGLAANFLSGRGLVTAEFVHMEGPGLRVRGGTEYWLHRTIALRVGYDDASPAGGFSYRVAPDMKLDYGMISHELGLTHKLGVSYRFGGFHAAAEARPDVFSPLGERPVTKIGMSAHTKGETRRWALTFVDQLGETVREFGGAGSPPSHLMWDGKNAVGLSLPDGTYTYQLVVFDGNGSRVEAHARAVEIATGGVRGSVPVLVN